MNNERYNQIIDETYNSFFKHTITGVNNGLDKIKGHLLNCLVEFNGYYKHFTNPTFQYGYRPLLKEEFIYKCKTDQEFSERWGLKIEERELSEKERMKLAGYEGVGGIGQNIIRETVDIDDTIPRRAITLTYNNEKIEVYE